MSPLIPREYIETKQTPTFDREGQSVRSTAHSRAPVLRGALNARPHLLLEGCLLKIQHLVENEAHYSQP